MILLGSVCWQKRRRKDNDAQRIGTALDFELTNNLWVSIHNRYAWENGSNTTINWRMDSDHNGFDGQNYQYAFKWGDRLDDIAAFTTLTGQDANSIQVNIKHALIH